MWENILSIAGVVLMIFGAAAWRRYRREREQFLATLPPDERVASRSPWAGAWQVLECELERRQSINPVQRP
jgi:hypothetical protein